jgi:peptide/nickel transport system substrate-binding protein
MLKRVGIDLGIDYVSDEDYNLLEATKGLDLDIYFHNNGTLDSYLILRDLYHSRGSPLNLSRYKNPEVDELLDQIEIEMSTYVRDGLLEQVWRIVLGDVVRVPLFQEVRGWAIRDGIELPIDVRTEPDLWLARIGCFYAKCDR